MKGHIALSFSNTTRNLVKVTVIAISIIFVVQIVNSYLWITKERRLISNYHLSTDPRTIVGYLEESVLLAQKGKKLGHSDSDMVMLPSQALRTVHHEVGGSEKKEVPTPATACTITTKAMESTLTYPWCNISDPVNPHDYELVINQPNLCMKNRSEEEVFLLVLMFSSPANFKQRDIQRESCLSLSEVCGRKIQSVFILGDSGDKNISSKVVEESEKHHDILQENFRDTYRNLTIKTLMGMKWVSMYCSQAGYILKTDDDVFLSLVNIVQLLQKTPRKKYLTGHVFNNAKPVRLKSNKWYISETEYDRKMFPPYCSGTGYILSGDLPPKIFTQSLSIPYIFLEDVFIGLCIEKLNVVPTVNSGFFSNQKKYGIHIFNKACTVHMKKPMDILGIWNEVTGNRRNITC